MKLFGYFFFFFLFTTDVSYRGARAPKKVTFHQLFSRPGPYDPYGKLASGAESHYEICCSFPQNVRTLHALESSIFI